MLTNISSLYPVIFYLLAGIAVFTACFMIFAKNPIYSILSLIVNFVAVSGIYVLLNAQLLAFINIIVYAGAIMVLFIFVLMLINLKESAIFGIWKTNGSSIVISFVVVVGLMATLISLYLKDMSPSHSELLKNSTELGFVERLGKELFTNYILPFELTGVLFLTALIGAVIFGKK